MNIETLLIVMLICGTISLLIGRKKNLNGVMSFVTGAFLGLIGIVIILLLPTQLPKPPKGMCAVKCQRCSSVQNVALEQAEFECWQCKTAQPMRRMYS